MKLERTIKFLTAIALVATVLFIGGMFVALGPPAVLIR